jgi:hypothetical protein
MPRKKPRSAKPSRKRAITAHDFRKLALSMPGAEEREHMGHPDFRVNGKIFATLPERATLDEWGMVRLSPAEQREFTKSDAFESVGGHWGRLGCTYVRLAAVDRETLHRAIELAWEARASRQNTPPGRRG